MPGYDIVTKSSIQALIPAFIPLTAAISQAGSVSGFRTWSEKL
jgi:hypothetical protein